MEKPIFPTNTRRLKHALTTLALFTALAAIPAYFQTSSGETNALPPMPPIWSILEDADQDGMTDVDELLWGMDTLDPSDGLSDLDGDDIPLSWEFAIGTNPDMADTDMDDWSDSEEYLLYGTDPLDPLSFPEGGTPESGGTTDPPNPPGDISDPEPTPPPSLSNGDFSTVGITTWKSMLTSKEYQGKGFEWNAGAITSWSAYVGTTMEVWKVGEEKFVELDGSPGNYGIKQIIDHPKAGGYVLAWRHSGRNSAKAGADPYYVRVYYMNGSIEVPISQSTEFSGFDKMQWNDNVHCFQITSEQLDTANGNPIYVAFIPTGLSLNTYGTLIDKVNLAPMEINVDANRDGEITSDGKDETTQEEPFRFWENNDQDRVEVDEPAIATTPDKGGIIETKRDLEDFCRLKVQVGLPNEALRNGDFKIGLKFRNASGDIPSITLFPNQSADGNLDYLTHDGAAAAQITRDFLHGDSEHCSLIPQSYWEERQDSIAHLIFEGVTKGTAELVLVIHDKNGHELAEGAGTWIKILDVREMYQRARIANEAEQIPEPWVNQYPPIQGWLRDPNENEYIEDPNATDQTVIFVHGWRLTYKTYINWADTSYKRLWHQGFKGKFYTFRWATFSGDDNGLPDVFDDWLDVVDLGSFKPVPAGFTYNASEYRAWLCGPALANYVNQLPNPKKRSLFAHSMGNVIAGSALRSGMNISHYALCNAAVSAMCYDSSSLLHGNGNIWWPPPPLTPEYLQVTPDTHTNPWVRQYGLNNKFNYNNLQMHNFTLSEDSALGTWMLNNQFFKPEGSEYSYNPHDTSLTWPLNLDRVKPDGSVHRPVFSLPEAMAYVTKSLTAPAGRTPSTRGAIDSTVGMDSWFVDLHSAQWRLNYLQTNQFWFNLQKELRLDVK